MRATRDKTRISTNSCIQKPADLPDKPHDIPHPKPNSYADSETSDEPLSHHKSALDATLEGEATAMYIRRSLDHGELKVTHLARGLPVGGSLEYTDETTLTRAFQGRQEI